MKIEEERKIRIDLTEEEHQNLVSFLNDWLGRLGDVDEIKILAKLIERIDEDWVLVKEKVK